MLFLLGLLGGGLLTALLVRHADAERRELAPHRKGAAAAGGDPGEYERGAEVFVLPEGRWGHVVCSACGPGGCWVGVRLRNGRTWAGHDFELTR